MSTAIGDNARVPCQERPTTHQQAIHTRTINSPSPATPTARTPRQVTGGVSLTRQSTDSPRKPYGFATLPDETWVYPGHGDDTTLGAERPHLAEWRERGW